LGLTARNPWLVVAAATLAMSVSYIDRQALAALAPTVKAALDINHTQYGWLSSAFSMAYLVAAPLAGAVLDRVGSRRGLLWAVLIWSMVAALHAITPSFWVLFGLRIGLGITEAPSFPGATQSIKRVLPPRHHSTGFGLVFTGSSLGAMIAAPLAIAIHRRLDWRMAFVGVAILGLAWVPLWLAVTRTPFREQLGPASEEERRAAPATRLLSLLGQGEVQRAVFLVCASAPAIMFVLLWFPQYLETAHEIPQNDIGHYVWFPALLFDAGAVGFGFAGSRLGGTSPGLIGAAALMGASLAALPFVGDALTATVIGGVSMAGGAGLFALLTADMMARIDPAYVSRAGGLTAAAQSLAYVIAGPLVGGAVDRTHSYDGVTRALGLLAIPGALAWMFWPRVAPRRTTTS
jgi:ACS family hexuronate transporter-like MFS transporter